MIGKYHNHTMQINPRRREEEPQNTNSHKTSGRQLKQSNQLTLPREDYCKTRKDKQKCITKQIPTHKTHTQCKVHKTMYQQQLNQCLRTDSSLSYWGCFNAFYLHQIFALDHVVIFTKIFLNNAMRHHRETIKPNKHTMMKQRKELMNHR